MSGTSGTEILAAIKKAATWGTAVVLGANDGILVLPTSIKRDAPIEIDDSMGSNVTKFGDPGPVKVEGDIPAYLRYDGCDIPVALCMGTAGAPTQQGATAAYANIYKFAPLVDGLFATFARDLKSYINENPSIKIAGFTISGDIGQPLKLTLHTLCDDQVIDSSTNTTATFNNVTFVETANRVRFSQGVYRINDQSGAALGSGDMIYPSSFELKAMRSLEGLHTTQYQNANNQDLIDEPCNNGKLEITLSLTFPRHGSNAYLTDLGADTYKKMDLTFTGGLIETPYNREFKIELPNMQIKNADPADAEGNVTETIEFVCHAVDTPPTGMTVTDPFWISVINTRTTDPLA